MQNDFSDRDDDHLKCDLCVSFGGALLLLVVVSDLGFVSTVIEGWIVHKELRELGVPASAELYQYC